MLAFQLRERRIALRLSRRELANRLGISRCSIEAWELSRYPIPGPVRLALERLEALDKDAAKKRKRRALERTRKQSLELAPPVKHKFY